MVLHIDEKLRTGASLPTRFSFKNKSPSGSENACEDGIDHDILDCDMMTILSIRSDQVDLAIS